MFLNVVKTCNGKCKNVLNSFFGKSFSTIPQSSHYDIIIVGGGMVGSTLACTLGKNKKLAEKSILLLEQNSLKPEPISATSKYSNRVSAITPGTYNLLYKIGAWQHIEGIRYGTVKKMQVWDAMSPAIITLNNDNLDDAVSYIVENNLILHAVHTEMKETENVTNIPNVKIDNFKFPPFGVDEPVQICLGSGQTYTCDLLLGCDGANSLVRRSMGIQYLSWNYNQKGIVATLELEDECDNVVAWQRFLPSGPIAILPLNNQFSSLVWSTTPTEADKLIRLSEDDFISEINKALFKQQSRNEIINGISRTLDGCIKVLGFPSNITGECPPKVKKCQENSRASFPLGFGHATSYINQSVVLVGDAAHRIHPLAGQGVNLGFGDIDCLNKILSEMVFSGSKLNNMNYLKQYETERQRHNVPTMIAIDGLHKLYNNSFAPIVLARTIGLQITHALTPLKRAIISHASG